MDTPVAPPQPKPTTEPPTDMPMVSSSRKVLVGLGVLELIVPAISLYNIRQLSILYDSLGMTSSPWGKIFFIALFLLALVQIIIGICGWDEKLGKKKVNILLLVGLIAAVLSLPALLVFTIMPIYQLSSGL